MKVMKITRTHLLAYYAAVTFALHYASAVEDANCEYEEEGDVPPDNVDVSGEGWDEYVYNQTLRLMEFAKVTALLKAKLGRFPCYDGVGCFNPKDKMSLETAGPDSPKEIGTKITFFGKGAREGVVVSHATWPNVMEKRRWHMRRPLVAIIHGFTENGQRPWVISLKDSLMRYAHSNVLIVDWKKGATYPYYFRGFKKHACARCSALAAYSKDHTLVEASSVAEECSRRGIQPGCTSCWLLRPAFSQCLQKEAWAYYRFGSRRAFVRKQQDMHIKK
ncbi:uncharacterized protein [Dermacentor albipictus]|uniref:uncharacterized protein n=1 Tax=Dermacentor albipictus TaxID=60249 RepID=UPI0031FD129A